MKTKTLLIAAMLSTALYANPVKALLTDENFEDTSLTLNQQGDSPYATFGLTTSPFNEGAKAARLYLKEGGSTSMTVRSEVVERINDNAFAWSDTNKHRWYGLSIYLKDWAKDSDEDIITQWHGYSDTKTPPICVFTVDGQIQMNIEKDGNMSNSDNRVKLVLGAARSNVWIHFVYHMVFDMNGEGVTEVWMKYDDQDSVTHLKDTGFNTYERNHLPYFKAGVYKRHFGAVSSRTIIVDNVRIGNKSADFNSVAPAAMKSTVVNTVPSVGSFSLVDLSTGQKIRSMIEGETLNLALLPKSFTIAANTAPATVGNVKFALSGQQTASTTDTSSPYYMMNSSAWAASVGSYTLKAVPYTTTGLAGVGKAINFKVINYTDNNTQPVFTGFKLINADTDQVIGDLLNGSTLNLATLPTRNLNIMAATGSTLTSSVTFTVSGAESLSRTEGSAPYAVFGDTQGDYNAWTPVIGTYSIKAVSGTNSMMISFNVINQAVISGPVVKTFTLINAATDKVIRTLSNGDVIDFSSIGTNQISIRAEAANTTSMRWTLSGAQALNRIESAAPFALYGNSGDDYHSWTPAVGSYTLKAIPYSGPDATGTTGTSLTISFKVQQ